MRNLEKFSSELRATVGIVKTTRKNAFEFSQVGLLRMSSFFLISRFRKKLVATDVSAIALNRFFRLKQNNGNVSFRYSNFWKRNHLVYVNKIILNLSRNFSIVLPMISTHKKKLNVQPYEFTQKFSGIHRQHCLLSTQIGY